MKYFYSTEMNCAYFMEEDRLMGIELDDNIIDTAMAFQIPTWDEQLGSEYINSRAYKDIWDEALKALA